MSKSKPTISDKFGDLQKILEEYKSYFSLSINSPQDCEKLQKAIEILGSIESSYECMCDEIRNASQYDD